MTQTTLSVQRWKYTDSRSEQHIQVMLQVCIYFRLTRLCFYYLSQFPSQCSTVCTGRGSLAQRGFWRQGSGILEVRALGHSTGVVPPLQSVMFQSTGSGALHTFYIFQTYLALIAPCLCYFSRNYFNVELLIGTSEVYFHLKM